MTMSDKPAITLQEALKSLTPKDVRIAPNYHEQNIANLLAILERAEYAMEQARKANLQESQQSKLTPEEFVKLHALNDTTIWTGQPDKSLCELPEPVASLNGTSKLPPLSTTLSERGARYGKFSEHAEITQHIKTAFEYGKNWANLPPPHREALEMIAHKIGRILNGDPHYSDSWIDIAGYAKLVADLCEGVDN